MSDDSPHTGSAIPGPSPSQPVEGSAAAQESGTGPLQWTDASGVPWRISLLREMVRFASEEHIVDLPRSKWASDLTIARHGRNVMVRVDTFEASTAFVITPQQAQPLLEYIAAAASAAAEGRAAGAHPFAGRDAEPSNSRAAEDEDSRRALMWPKVSPLAVWALICSALVFIPVLGWASALATIVLLVMHGRRVRRSQAWAHSRALCRAATVFLLVGLITSIIITWSAFPHISRAFWETTNTHELQSSDKEGHLNFSFAGSTGEGSSTPPPKHPTIEKGAPVPQADQAVGAGVDPGAMASAASATCDMLGFGNAWWEQGINWGYFAAALFVLLFGLSLHEAGHAITAWWMGDDFARRLGRVTLNPLYHIDPIGTVLLPFLLSVFAPGLLFGYAKSVPVIVENTPNPRKSHILISLAGPGVNMLIASASFCLLILLMAGLRWFFPDLQVSQADSSLGINLLLFAPWTVEFSGVPAAAALQALFMILALSVTTNIFLGFFNLVPIPPLDGSWVLENLFPRTLGPLFVRIRPYGFLIFVLLLQVGLFQFLLIPVYLLILPGEFMLQSVLAG